MNISECASQLRAGHEAWNEIILDCPGRRIDETLSWPQRDGGEARLAATWESHGAASSGFQYSLRLIDESLIQMFYGFRKTHLEVASLALLEGMRNWAIRDLPIDPALDLIGELERNQAPPPNYGPAMLRIDYDPDAERPVEHPACHLHWSMFPSSRVPVNGVPTPAQFLEFCIRTALPSIYHEARKEQIGKGFMVGVNEGAGALDLGVDGLIALAVPKAGATDLRKKPIDKGPAKRRSTSRMAGPGRK